MIIPSHTDPAGLYVHIPFCKRKCPYCDFYSVTDLERIPLFLKGLAKEMELIEWDLPGFDTFYFGGGTPSLLDVGDIEQVIETGFRQFEFLPDVEITVEVNPGTVTAEKLADYGRIGINRLNIGVQSFQDANLEFLGRIHSSAESKQIIDLARRDGFTNIGLDLIYGLPGQSIDDWKNDLQQAVAFKPEHLSCYMLTCENGTPLSQNVRAGRTVMPPDDLSRTLFDFTIDFLDSNNYVQYEISNFARREDGSNKLFTSRHNQKYWSFAPYIGLGPSAHSFCMPNRRWNHRELSRYSSNLQEGKLPTAGKETLTRDQLMMEAIFLGLRTTRGIDRSQFNQIFGIDFVELFRNTVAGLEEAGYVCVSEQRCALSRRGLPLVDSIVNRLVNQEIP